jgi:hypothetical protein
MLVSEFATSAQFPLLKLWLDFRQLPISSQPPWSLLYAAMASCSAIGPGLVNPGRRSANAAPGAAAAPP